MDSHHTDGSVLQISTERDGYIGVSDWSKRYGISRAWACRLCVAGRVEGAMFVDGRWLIPEGVGMPARKVSPVLLARHEAALLRHRATEGGVLPDALRDHIQNCVDEGWEFDEAGNGRFEGQYFQPVQGWGPAAWVFYRSIVK